MDALWLTAFCLAYLAANRPFLDLACHQDAGWHSYWAAFRRRGVGLERQLNVLMGCARLGSKFLFVVWFALFGRGDPDALARKVALGLNMLVALGIHAVLAPRLGSGAALAAAGLSLVMATVPTFGIHYETAERTMRPLNLALFAAALALLEHPDPVLLGFLVAAMIGLALLFKITQLFEYLPLWLVLFFAEPSWAAFGASCVGGLAALAGFAALLAGLGLLKAENLGILGYMATSRRGGRDAGAAQGPSLDQRIDAKLAQGEFGRLGRLVVALARRSGTLSLLPRFFGMAVNARQFLPTVLGPVKGLMVLILAGLWLEPDSAAKMLLAAWLGGAVSGLILQARFLPLHFVPVLLPASIVAGLGLLRVDQSILAGEVGGALWLAAAAFMLLLDARWLAGRRRFPLDLRFWPQSQHAIIARNLLARQLAPVLAERAAPQDYILVWGTLPQIYVLAERRCPVNWLTTNPILMNPILPNWRALLWQSLRETPPVLILEIDADLDMAELERSTGLAYGLEASGPGWRLLRRAEGAP
ncbi:MAG: hypothetical protein HY055_13735 [Magnetospirillum sp.]|nr:hypothetical protein [Magnetospirillum sp.]